MRPVMPPSGGQVNNPEIQAEIKWTLFTKPTQIKSLFSFICMLHTHRFALNTVVTTPESALLRVKREEIVLYLITQHKDDKQC